MATRLFSDYDFYMFLFTNAQEINSLNEEQSFKHLASCDRRPKMATNQQSE
jgi:hypothetical protein